MYIYTIFYLPVVNSNFAIDNRLSIATFLKAKKKNVFEVRFYTIFFFHDLIHVALAQGQRDPRALNFGVNRKALSLFPFVASFKEISLKSDFIQLFS